MCSGSASKVGFNEPVRLRVWFAVFFVYFLLEHGCRGVEWWTIVVEVVAGLYKEVCVVFEWYNGRISDRIFKIISICKTNVNDDSVEKCGK